MMILRNGPNAKPTPLSKIRPAVYPDDLVVQAKPMLMQNRWKYFVVDLSSNRCTEEDFMGLREEISNNFDMEVSELFNYDIDSCSALPPHMNDEIFDGELASYLRSLDIAFFDKDHPEITRAPGDRNYAVGLRMVFVPGMNLALVVASHLIARLHAIMNCLENEEDLDEHTIQEVMQDYLGDDIGLYSFQDGIKRLLVELGTRSDTAERVVMAEQYAEIRKSKKTKKATYVTWKSFNEPVLAQPVQADDNF